MQAGCIDCGVFTILAMDFLSRADSGTFPSAHEVKQDKAAAALLTKPWEQESVGKYRRHIFDCICRSEWQSHKACAVGAVGEGEGEGGVGNDRERLHRGELAVLDVTAWRAARATTTAEGEGMGGGGNGAKAAARDGSAYVTEACSRGMLC